MKKAKNFISLFLSVLMMMSLITVAPVYADAGTVTITSPAADSATVGKTVTLTAEAADFETLTFYIDGVSVKEFTEAAAGDSYSFEASVDAGTRVFKAVAKFADGTEAADEVSFKVYANSRKQLNNATTVKTADFNDLPDGIPAGNALNSFEGANYSGIAVDSVNADITKTYGWKISELSQITADTPNVAAGITSVPGKSGDDGDRAIQIFPDTANKETIIKLNSWTGPTTGTLVFDFDFAVQGGVTSSHCALQLGGFPEIYSEGTKNRNTIFSGGSFKGFDKELTTGTWYSMHYEYDVTNNKCTLVVNGDKVWDNAACSGKGSYTGLQYLFLVVNWDSTTYTAVPGTISGSSTYKNAWIALDNMAVYMKDTLTTKDKAYHMNRTNQLGTNKTNYGAMVPANAATVRMSMSRGMDTKELIVNEDDVTLSVNGVPTETTTRCYSGVSFADIPAGVEKGDILKLTLKGTDLTNGQDMSEIYVVGEPINIIASSSSSKLSYTLYADDTANGSKLIVAFYNDGELVGINTPVDVALTDGAMSVSEIACPETATTAKIMVWNDMQSITPLYKPAEVKIVR